MPAILHFYLRCYFPFALPKLPSLSTFHYLLLSCIFIELLADSPLQVAFPERGLLLTASADGVVLMSSLNMVLGGALMDGGLARLQLRVQWERRCFSVAVPTLSHALACGLV